MPSGHAYSPDSRYLAVAERHSGKEYIGIYDVGLEYQLLRVRHRARCTYGKRPVLIVLQHFLVETTDVQGLSWSPCGRYLALHDSSIQVR